VICARHSSTSVILFGLGLVLLTFLSGCTPATPETPSPISNPTEIPARPTPVPSQPLFSSPANPTPSQSDPILPTPAASPTDEATIPTPVSTPDPGPIEINFGPWVQVLALAWHPNGEILAISASSSIFIYSYPSLTELARFEAGASTYRLAFQPLADEISASSILVGGMKDGRLVMWDIEKGEQLCWMTAHRRGITGLAFTPDGRYFATAGVDPIMKLWEFPVVPEGEICQARLAAEFIGGAKAVPDMDLSPDGSQIAAIDLGVIRLREVISQRLIVNIQTGATTYCLKYNPDGSLIAGCGDSNKLRLWELDNGDLFRTLSLDPEGAPGNARDFIWRVDFDSSGEILAAGSSDGRIGLWPAYREAQTGSALIIGRHGAAVTTIAFHPTGRVLATGSLDGTLYIWSLSQ
jgi:WD40 repeat protein